MSTTIVADKAPETLFKKTAVKLLGGLLPIVDSRDVLLGLCGGRSVVGLINAIKALASEISPESENVRNLLKKTHFFMVDERLVPLEDPDSNFGMLKKGLFDELLKQGVIDECQLHPFIPCEKDTDFGTRSYFKVFSEFGQRFDGVVLGVGEDGHVAGLFPRHQTLKREEPNFVSFFDSPKPPAGRMTATLPLVVETSATVLLFTGEAKRQAWERFNSSATPPEECPSIFLKNCQNLIIATDLA